MNYTNPENPDHDDSPEDWLNSSLIFARTLSLILQENEGMIVEIQGDMHFFNDESVKKVIVYKNEGKIRVIECEEDLPEGQFVIIHDINPN
jgi:hypothetical protein